MLARRRQREGFHIDDSVDIVSQTSMDDQRWAFHEEGNQPDTTAQSSMEDVPSLYQGSEKRDRKRTS